MPEIIPHVTIPQRSEDNDIRHLERRICELEKKVYMMGVESLECVNHSLEQLIAAQNEILNKG